MNQIENITCMEQKLDEATAVIKDFTDAFEKYVAAQTYIKELVAYYESEEWRRDFEDDDAGRLPKDLKRGVLSEDGIYNLLAENRALLLEMQELVEKNVRDL